MPPLLARLRRHFHRPGQDLTKSQEDSIPTLCTSCIETFEGTREWDLVTGHHASLAQFEDSLVLRCWICLALRRQLSDEQFGALLEHGQAWLESRPGGGYFTFTQISNTSDASVKGPTGTFEYHLMFSSDITDQLQPIGRRSQVYYGYPAVFLWAQPTQTTNDRLLATPCGTSTASTEAWAVAVSRFETCTSCHEVCNQTSLPFSYPSRLLDVAAPDASHSTVKLIDTREVHVHGNYLTLSHRWGKDRFLVLRPDNTDQFKSGIPISDLSATFQDAVEVARMADWEFESKHMHEYYSNALCNISASAADGTARGMFQTRDSTALQHHQYRMPLRKGRTPGLYDVFDITSWEADLDDAPLAHRAWCLQERLLAKRVLHFGRHQLLWECREHNAAGIYPFGVPNIAPLQYRIHFKDLSTSSIWNQQRFGTVDQTALAYKLWYRIVSSYSACLLSFPEDKLRAIAGLVAHFEHELQDKCIMGCWQADFQRQLLWHVQDRLYPPTNMLYDVNHSYPDIPSWSWLASDCPIDTGKRLGVERQAVDEEMLFSMVNLHETIATMSQSSGTTLSSSIRISCHINDAEMRLGREGLLGLRLPDVTSRGQSKSPTIWLDGPIGGLAAPDDCVAVAVVPMRRYRDQGNRRQSQYSLDCLLLQRQARFPNAYRRIGLVTATDDEGMQALTPTSSQRWSWLGQASPALAVDEDQSTITIL
ncbi:hypothetical protein LTR15_008548 [Elasticomyces elasticus]|nr:hypothetical protein LTR15_008548 [Elasticomyces elasticus]